MAYGSCMRRKQFIAFFLFAVWVLVGVLLSAQFIIAENKLALGLFLPVWLVLFFVAFRVFHWLP
jgi:hypothetical protein